jgi:hypothetical protein
MFCIILLFIFLDDVQHKVLGVVRLLRPGRVRKQIARFFVFIHLKTFTNTDYLAEFLKEKKIE